MPHRIPLALYVGPAHVLAETNETWDTVFGREPPIGVPAVEAFEGPGWGDFIKALDRAWETGEPSYAPCEDHDSQVVILPLLEQGQVVALVTGCALERIGPMRASRPLPLPAVERTPA